MSNRELVINLVTKLPEDTPLHAIARQIRLTAGIKDDSSEAGATEGISAEEARQLLKEWAAR